MKSKAPTRREIDEMLAFLPLSMSTYCVRGERFCDGHWGAMIEQGHVRRLLERLTELRDAGA